MFKIDLNCLRGKEKGEKEKKKQNTTKIKISLAFPRLPLGEQKTLPSSFSLNLDSLDSPGNHPLNINNAWNVVNLETISGQDGAHV